MQTAQVSEQGSGRFARAARDVGIERAAIGADNHSPNWSELAYEFLQGFALVAATFTAEAVREAAERWNAVDTPPDKRAWGGVFNRASRQGLIKREGFVTARDPKVHCNNVSLWRSTIVRRAA